MSDIIQLLPDSVANQIAAGEVIQRPASVIKELVENAVDAGAKTINVVVVDAGRTSIQVVDDGCGMSDTDARLCFERHATSKIRSADDLFDLHTMGFRGEALPSIAAVSQLELRTRRHENEIGTLLLMSASKVEEQRPIACPAGSNFTIKNIFFNVPARRKFLKSNTTELNNILAAFERIVLVYPDIHFTFHSNGSELYNLHPASMRQRVIDVFGKRINHDLLSIDIDTTLCQLKGFVGRPESAKKKGAHQFFFVNGRYMRHPYFHKAVMSAFERLLPAGEQVPYFIYITVPPADIDVNIHPTKTEIKFENEQSIWQILATAVREAVGRYHDATMIDFDVQGKPDIPVYNESDTNISTMPHVSVDNKYNPFNNTGKRQRTAKADDWEQLYNELSPASKTDTEQPLFDDLESDKESVIDDKSPIHYQYKAQYVMTTVKSGLMIIDQHRAHMRILFEDYLERMSQHCSNVQKILFPEMVHFSASEDAVISTIMTKLTDMGFELSNLGGGDYAVSGIPDGALGISVDNLLHEMVSVAAEHDGKTVSEISSLLAANLARHAAIPYGQVMSNDEMDNLVNRLFSCSDVNHTPDGKQIFAVINQSDIEKLF